MKETVQASLSRVAEAPAAGCSILFTEPRPAHDKIRARIFGARAEDSSAVSTLSDGSRKADRVTASLEDAYVDNALGGQNEGASEPYFDALVAEVKKPFVYDSSNEVC